MGTGTAKLPLFPQPNLFLPISVWWMAFHYHAMATDWKIFLPLPRFCVCSNICPGFNQKQADTHTSVHPALSHSDGIGKNLCGSEGDREHEKVEERMRAWDGEGKDLELQVMSFFCSSHQKQNRSSIGVTKHHHHPGTVPIFGGQSTKNISLLLCIQNSSWSKMWFCKRGDTAELQVLLQSCLIWQTEGNARCCRFKSFYCSSSFTNSRAVIAVSGSRFASMAQSVYFLMSFKNNCVISNHFIVELFYSTYF